MKILKEVHLSVGVQALVDKVHHQSNEIYLPIKAHAFADTIHHESSYVVYFPKVSMPLWMKSTRKKMTLNQVQKIVK